MHFHSATMATGIHHLVGQLLTSWKSKVRGAYRTYSPVCGQGFNGLLMLALHSKMKGWCS